MQWQINGVNEMTNVCPYCADIISDKHHQKTEKDRVFCTWHEKFFEKPIKLGSKDEQMFLSHATNNLSITEIEIYPKYSLIPALAVSEPGIGKYISMDNIYVFIGGRNSGIKFFYGISYTVDFRFKLDGKERIVDVKGKPGSDGQPYLGSKSKDVARFRLNCKLMNEIHGKEVFVWASGNYYRWNSSYTKLEVWRD